jgi:hypothetical protein
MKNESSSALFGDHKLLHLVVIDRQALQIKNRNQSLTGHGR